MSEQPRVEPKRIRLLQDGLKKKGPVLYWMSRDQRAHDNWALLFAMQLAREKSTFVIVAFSLVTSFLEAGRRQYSFLLDGLRETEAALLERGIPFILLNGEPQDSLPAFIDEHNVSAVVSDFDPLRIKRLWKKHLAKKIRVPFYEADAHNIVPCLFISQKQEFAAYSLRPKLNRALPDFLDPFPALPGQTAKISFPATDWPTISRMLQINESVLPVKGILPGYNEAVNRLEQFLESRLSKYYSDRNNPAADGQSGISPYLHFGQLSAQRVAMAVHERFTPSEETENFLEELIVRRELSDNYCYFNHEYDSFNGFHPWAQETLEKHRDDPREYVYSREQFEQSETHDDLWNAAQTEMVIRGKMHGYLRMYWAKKILEWTSDPETALQTAIFLNDKYELDGRDPNGYAGCAWAIGGVHDRPWPERPVFGKIRFMNYAGCKRKFDINAYIAKVKSLTK